ncbi:hypothetical protein STHAL_20090 [Streptomyces halstedii]|uniref:Translation initiation factor IF-2 n=1 Tax=Streptomyces halstedii TaxID=1944 RepID=A0ABS6TUH8_STRHA|nr:hypothetical protein [Streptomyces halstedii]MBV7671751.1 hypothetical protein [Streptomyces halstedii]
MTEPQHEEPAAVAEPKSPGGERDIPDAEPEPARTPVPAPEPGTTREEQPAKAGAEESLAADTAAEKPAGTEPTGRTAADAPQVAKPRTAKTEVAKAAAAKTGTAEGAEKPEAVGETTVKATEPGTATTEVTEPESTEPGTATAEAAKTGTAARAGVAVADTDPPVNSVGSATATGDRIGRPGKALLAGAAIAGLLLVSVPFLVRTGDGDSGRPAAGEESGTVLGQGETAAPGAFAAASPGTPQAKGKDQDKGGQGAKEGEVPVTAGGVPAPGADPATGGDKGSGEAIDGGKDATVPGTAASASPDAPSAKKSSSPQTSAPKAQMQAASTVVYSAVAGPGCPVPSGGGYKQHNYFADGTKGWYTRTTGAWTGDGCNGGYVAVPMSGSTSTDAKNRVMWWWRPGTTARTCQISVFVPHSNTTLYVGGHPTTYHVLVDANDRTTKYDSFTVNQASLRGRWVDAGTFSMKGATIGVKLLDRGDDWSSGWGKAHHAAAQMKVTCRS